MGLWNSNKKKASKPFTRLMCWRYMYYIRNQDTDIETEEMEMHQKDIMSTWDSFIIT